MNRVLFVDKEGEEVKNVFCCLHPFPSIGPDCLVSVQGLKRPVERSCRPWGANTRRAVGKKDKRSMMEKTMKKMKMKAERTKKTARMDGMCCDLEILLLVFLHRPLHLSLTCLPWTFAESLEDGVRKRTTMKTMKMMAMAEKTSSPSQ